MEEMVIPNGKLGKIVTPFKNIQGEKNMIQIFQYMEKFWIISEKTKRLISLENHRKKNYKGIVCYRKNMYLKVDQFDFYIISCYFYVHDSELLSIRIFFQY
ncbi:hypothetical protein ACJX0J_039361, partial [Zea mays]